MLFFCCSSFPQEAPMPHTFKPGFTVVGLSARTNNAMETTPSGRIGLLWRQFLSGRLADTIPSRADGKVIAVLTDYASDEKGDYTYILGVRVREASHIPDGMVAREVPPDNYALVVSEDGVPSRVVPEAWKRIWSMSTRELGGNRAFRTDFEEYDESALTRPSIRASIYLSMK
jgi:predicted transcriptional regulator YdeE